MSQTVRKVDSVNINSFEPGLKQVPVDLSDPQSDQLKQDLQPLFNALIQNALFKKKFTEELSPASSEIPINITLSEKTLIVTNKATHKTSKFSVGQDPKNASLKAIIARIFQIAENALPNKEKPKAPIEKTPEPDFLDVSQLTDPVLKAPQTLEKGPFEDLFIPSSSDRPTPANPKNTSLQSILKLYDDPEASPQKPLNQDPLSIKPQYHFQEEGAPKSERPYLEDLFYDLPKKQERENLKNPEKHTALSDINAFEYLKEWEHLENQKRLAIQADLTVASSTYTATTQASPVS